MYSALSKKPNKFEGHHPKLDIYRKSSPPQDGTFKFKSKFHGMIRDVDGKWYETNEFSIGYTQWGNKGPICLLLHGVPTNRNAKFPIQDLLSPFCRTISIDMLGMGGDDEDGNISTSMPQLYGKREGMSIFDDSDSYAWDWINDCDYIHDLMNDLYPGEKWFFQADDWGGGILSHYIAKYPTDLLGAIWVDPIAFDGYPVNEIQAFGRAATIPREDICNSCGDVQEEDIKFKEVMGAADQTMVQILKTMVKRQEVYNQYSLKEITRAYVENDYERKDANSLTLKLKYDNMRTLCERAARLEPAQLLPFDCSLNPKGVDYSKYRGHACVLWSRREKMMPSSQKWRFKSVLTNAQSVEIHTVDNSDHFLETDQPEQVAENMYSFISNVVGLGQMGDICLGLDPLVLWKGDERQMIEDLRKLWKIGEDDCSC